MSSISLGAWLAAPILAYFWIYKSWPFWKSLFTSAIIWILISFLKSGAVIEALVFIFIIAGTLWVYGDSLNLKVRFRWIFIILTFLVLPVGLVSYYLLRGTLSKRKVEKIESDGGVIEIHN